MVLGYSRMIYVEFVRDEKLSTLLRCHNNAFEYFGGAFCFYQEVGEDIQVFEGTGG